MATYHLKVKNGLKGTGLKHAQYIERDDSYVSSYSVSENGGHYDYITRANRYSHKQDLVAAESGNLPVWAKTADDFWAAADKYERANGRTYRELEISLPRELTDSQNIELIRQLVKDVLGSRSFTYTWAYHKPIAADGEENPHVHLMFSEREHDGIPRNAWQFFRRYNTKNPHLGGAKKNRYFGSRMFVSSVREQWTNTCNEYLRLQDVSARIDHRSYEDRGIELESQNWEKQFFKDKEIAKNWAFMTATRVREIMQRNGERIIADPSVAIRALTSNESAFTLNDLRKFINQHTDGEEQFTTAYNAVLHSDFLQKVAGTEYYTSTEMYLQEASIIAQINSANLSPVREISEEQQAVIEEVKNRRTFNSEQEKAYRLLLGNAPIVTVNGAAGTGKSYVLSAMNEAFIQQGIPTFGIAFQTATAKDMQESGGIRSFTIDAFLHRVSKQKMTIPAGSVIVLDEAGMVGSRHMEQILRLAADHHAKIRMVGDSFQLSSVSAGKAFSAVQKNLREDCQTSLVQIMRQKNEQMRQASMHLSEHQIAQALAIYRENFAAVHEAEFQQQAAAEAVGDWYVQRRNGSYMMLTYTNRDAAELNRLARNLLRADGELEGQEYSASVRIGNRTRTLPLSVGDKIVFKENNRDMGVINGTFATVRAIEGYDGEAERLTVATDDGRTLSFALNDYNKINHAYATTIHQSQGLTVDNACLLAGEGMTANLAYVGMTRHRQNLRIYYSKEKFADGYDELVRELAKTDQKLFIGDKELVKEIEQVKQREIVQYRASLAERILGDKGKADFDMRQLLRAVDTDIGVVREDMPSERISAAYKDYLRQTGRLPKQYRLGNTVIGTGDRVQLQEDHKIKLGFLRSRTLSADQVFTVKAVSEADKQIVLSDAEAGIDYTLSAAEIRLRPAREYAERYRQDKAFREKVNMAVSSAAQSEKLKLLRATVQSNRQRHTQQKQNQAMRQKQGKRQRM